MSNVKKINLETIADDLKPASQKRHPKCRGYFDAYSGDHDCDYDSTLTCDECKYGLGRKDPEAKKNQT